MSDGKKKVVKTCEFTPPSLVTHIVMAKIVSLVKIKHCFLE